MFIKKELFFLTTLTCLMLYRKSDYSTIDNLVQRIGI